MSYTVKLEVFEGPFDLLVHLIEKAKVDIYNIPIAKITEQYLEYLEGFTTFDLEIASEFLVMAASLIEIKSKMLLPDKNEEQLSMDIVEEDPRQDLVKRLLEYKKFKNAAEEFKKREEEYKRIYYKPQDQLDQYIDDDNNELLDLKISDLVGAFNNLLIKKRNSANQYQMKIREIEREEISIENKINEIKKWILSKKNINFQQLIMSCSCKSEAIVTFLALLELVKIKYLIIKQSKVFGEIIVIINSSTIGVHV